MAMDFVTFTPRITLAALTPCAPPFYIPMRVAQRTRPFAYEGRDGMRMQKFPDQREALDGRSVDSQEGSPGWRLAR
jgi:hypothetical protein